VNATTGPPPLRVARSARVSTRDKDQDPELQVHPMREYAAARGWLPTEHVDHAAAGDLAGRTAWTRLLADARRRRVDHVLVWKLDRAFRSTLHCLSALQEFEHRGVGFACLTQPEVDTTSPAGRLLLTLLAALAESERYADIGVSRDTTRLWPFHAA
jgi:DNA invertase Pin-like site-specific DNA recombinase